MPDGISRHLAAASGQAWSEGQVGRGEHVLIEMLTCADSMKPY